MKLRFQPWQLAVLLVLGCILGIGTVRWLTSRQGSNPAWLLQTLPEDRSVHFFVNVESLRDSDFLDIISNSNVPEEPDYQRFVQETGFDYRTDLNQVAGAFTDGGLYLAAQGQFDWSRLTAYARSHGGLCQNSICQMPASQPGRNISYYPLRADVLALAVSTEARGTNSITPSQWRQAPQIPSVPLWISAPAAKFQNVAALPTGSHSFLSPLEQSERAVFTLAAATGTDVDGMALRLDAPCKSAETAAEIARQLTSTTDLLRSMLVRDNLKPSPADLSGVLTSGHFEVQGTHVQGTWDIDRRFINTLVSGQLK